MDRIRAKLGEWLLIQRRDGRCYVRRPGEPDMMMPYAPEHAEICVDSAVNKYGWTRFNEHRSTETSS